MAPVCLQILPRCLIVQSAASEFRSANGCVDRFALGQRSRWRRIEWNNPASLRPGRYANSDRTT